MPKGFVSDGGEHKIPGNSWESAEKFPDKEIADIWYIFANLSLNTLWEMLPTQCIPCSLEYVWPVWQSGWNMSISSLTSPASVSREAVVAKQQRLSWAFVQVGTEGCFHWVQLEISTCSCGLGVRSLECDVGTKPQHHQGLFSDDS